MLHIVERLDLIRAAVDLLREQHLLIEAPAGYGKSLLLQQLLSYLPGAAYLPLSVDDNDLAILRRRVQDSGAETLLLDDVHHLSVSEEAAGWLQTQLRTPSPRLLLAGRYLPFDAAMYLAQGDARRWDERQLVFPAHMAAELLGEEEDGQVDAWHLTLDGWPMAIGLLQQLPPAMRRPTALQSNLFDYLAQTVFGQLGDDVKRFLRVTAVPIEYSAGLAAHLLGMTVDEARAHVDTIRRRNLFLSEGGRPQTYRYHDLFREFLLAQSTGQARRALAVETVAYLDGAGHYAPAVEQALEAGLHERAATLLLDVDWEFVHATTRYRTFDRWVMALDAAVRDAHPDLYWMAGHCLIYLPDREQEAFSYFERSEILAIETEDGATVYAARYERAHLRYMLHGASAELAEELAQIAAHAPPDQKSGLRARRTLSAVLAELGRLREAQKRWREAYRQAQQLDSGEMLLEMMKRQYALYMLIPLGAYAEAREIFASAIDYTADSPGNQLEVLVNYCDLLLPMGAWAEMEAVRARIAALAAQVDEIAGYLQLWLHFYDGMLALAHRRPQQADMQFKAMGVDEGHSLELVCERLGRICLARQKGDLQAIAGWLEDVDRYREDAPYYAAWAHLEADIALGLAAVREGRVHTVSPATLQLYRFRARGDLLRLRALITLLCYEQRQPRWRRMARIVLRELVRPHYPELLTQRDPELGATFWRVLLVEGIEEERAVAALVACGLVEPLLPLVRGEGEVRALAARIVAQIGDERAMDALNEAIAAEKNKETRQSLEAALEALETRPPPALHITLMGGFAVRRGGETIDDFHRPIVARLLQFFAIHRGRPLARDFILEALWPGTDPDKAWRTFRTVYSRLRNALEPHMRSKGPNRYFSPEGDSYTFDMQGYVTVDTEQFLEATGTDLPPDEMAALLESYRPVLPELGSVDWLLEVREQMQEVYVTACLRLGERLLARGDAADAQKWAQRVIQTAPWMEAAYQLLMRAYARQNLRSRALRTYDEARAALQRELAVDPSPLTEWLVERLQKGEAI